jgi:hypothetical protein
MVKEVLTDALLKKSRILENLGKTQSKREKSGIGCESILSTLKEIQINTSALLFPQFKKTFLRLSNLSIKGARLLAPSNPSVPSKPQQQHKEQPPTVKPKTQELSEPARTRDLFPHYRTNAAPRLRDERGRFMAAPGITPGASIPEQERKKTHPAESPLMAPPIAPQQQNQQSQQKEQHKEQQHRQQQQQPKTPSKGVEVASQAQETKKQKETGKAIGKVIKESFASKVMKHPVIRDIRGRFGSGGGDQHNTDRIKDAAGLATGGPFWDAYKEIKETLSELKGNKTLGWIGKITGITALKNKVTAKVDEKKERVKSKIEAKATSIRAMAVQRFQSRAQQKSIQDGGSQTTETTNIKIPTKAAEQQKQDHWGGDSTYHRDALPQPGVDPREGTKPIIDSLKSGEQHDEKRHKELIQAIKGIKLNGEASGGIDVPKKLLKNIAKRVPGALSATAAAAGPAALIAAMGGMALAGKKRMDEHPDEAAQMADWGSAEGASMNLGNKDAWKPPDTTPSTPSAPTPTTTAPQAPAGLGSMSAKFESGPKGSRAIGYDNTGGTSYGKYQIASKTGTMNQFIKHLEKSDPAAAAELKAAGPLNTGSDKGAAVDTWKKLEKEGRIQGAEHDYIKQSHYDPEYKQLNPEVKAMIDGSDTLKDELWSRSVHTRDFAHKDFNSAYNEIKKEKGTVSPEDLTSRVYDKSATHFSEKKLGSKVYGNVQKRLKVDEKKLALARLANEKNSKKEPQEPQAQKPAQEEKVQPAVQEKAKETTTTPSTIQQQETTQPAPILKPPVEQPQRITPTEQAQPTRPGPWDPAAAQRQESLSSTSKIEGLLQQLITVQQQKQPEPDPKGEKAMNIPTEFDDTTLTLMAYDRI